MHWLKHDLLLANYVLLFVIFLCVCKKMLFFSVFFFYTFQTGGRPGKYGQLLHRGTLLLQLICWTSVSDIQLNYLILLLSLLSLGYVWPKSHKKELNVIGVKSVKYRQGIESTDTCN